MAYEHKPGRGSLFPNTRKRQDTHPDNTGTINIEGRLFYIDAWAKPGKDGKGSWLSLSVKPVEQRQEQPIAKPKQPGGFEDMEDSIPF